MTPAARPLALLLPLLAGCAATREPGPPYVRHAACEERWEHGIREGIDSARAWFGEHGPVVVYVLGEGAGAPGSEEADAVFLDALRPDRRASGERLLETARRGDVEAYMSRVDEPTYLAELVFVNPREFGNPELYYRGVHEYAHAFQHAYEDGGDWLMEGGAVFFEAFLGARDGRNEFAPRLLESLRNIEVAEGLDLELRDVEDRDDLPPLVEEHVRHLAYDLGAWAVAYAIATSPDRSVRSFCDDYHPRLRDAPWGAALAEYLGLPDLDAFYAQFAAFRRSPLEAQLAAFRTIRE